jgi:DNA-binding transcriptional LysR family regulator
MHLRTLELFCDVVRHGSFSKAARARNVSQSLASQAVHQLEERLGTQLIDRSMRPFRLTAAGRTYFDGCSEILGQFVALEDRVRDLGHCVAGRLSVVAIYSVGLLEMDTVIQLYRERFPDVAVSLEYLTPAEVYAQVHDGRAELGIVSFPPDRGEFATIPWQTQPMAAVLPAGHSLAGCKSLQVKQLQSEKLIAFRADLAIRRHIDAWLQEAGVELVVEHEFDNIENVKRAVEIGAGVSILPLPTVQRETEIGTLVAIPFSDVAWERPLGIIHRRQIAPRAAAREFIELLTVRADESRSAGPASAGRRSRESVPLVRSTNR